MDLVHRENFVFLCNTNSWNFFFSLLGPLTPCLPLLRQRSRIPFSGSEMAAQTVIK